MICVKCDKEIPDDALFCPWCGKKQAATRMRRQKRPTGAGSIVKLKGRRSRPYAAKMPAIYRDGKALRVCIGYFATYREADDALRQAIVKTPKELAGYTLEDLYNRFIAGNYFSNLSEGGQASHRGAWKYLDGQKAKLVTKLTKADFQDAVDAMKARGLKRETMAKVRNLSSLLCKEAMGLGLMTVNYGMLVQLPREERTEPQPFGTMQLKKLWKLYDQKDKAAAAVLVLCYTGMRPGELLGVDIDKHLFICDTGRYFQTGSKTEAGRNRIIPIPKILEPVIDFLCAGRDSGVFVRTPEGKRWRLDNWRKRAFGPVADAIGAPWATPYTCRHTYSNLQKRRGTDPELMMEIMGHKDYSTTVERYHTTTAEDLKSILKAVEGFARPV